MAIYRQLVVSTTPVKLMAAGGGPYRYVRYQVLTANVRMRYDDLASELTPETGFVVFAGTTDVLSSGAHIEACHVVREGSSDAIIEMHFE